MQIIHLNFIQELLALVSLPICRLNDLHNDLQKQCDISSLLEPITNVLLMKAAADVLGMLPVHWLFDEVNKVCMLTVVFANYQGFPNFLPSFKEKAVFLL